MVGTDIGRPVGTAPYERRLSRIRASTRIYPYDAIPCHHTHGAQRAGTRRDSPRPHSIRQGRGGARSLASLKNTRNLAIRQARRGLDSRLAAARKSKRCCGRSRCEPWLPCCCCCCCCCCLHRKIETRRLWSRVKNAV